VHLPHSAVCALPGHRGLQDSERSGSNGSWHDGGLIFPNTLGGYADYTNLMPRHFKPLLRRAGLPDIRFHDLRHTRATLMLAVSTNPKEGQETLGHANVSVTLDIYSHLLPNMQDEVAQNINELHS
jgi:integrase